MDEPTIVELDDELLKRRVGVYVPEFHEILIYSDLPPDLKRAVVAHEMTRARHRAWLLLAKRLEKIGKFAFIGCAITVSIVYVYGAEVGLALTAAFGLALIYGIRFAIMAISEFKARQAEKRVLAGR